jgi:hypothetical protein
MADFEFEFEATTPEELDRALADLPGHLQTELNDAAMDIGERIRGQAAGDAAVDTGQLESSIQSVVENIGVAVVQVRVGSDADQAAPIEYGTDPHFPPPSALRGWCRRVLGDESAAYAVARSISETGTEAQPFLEPAFSDNLTFAMNRINRAIDQAIDKAGLG